MNLKGLYSIIFGIFFFCLSIFIPELSERWEAWGFRAIGVIGIFIGLKSFRRKKWRDLPQNYCAEIKRHIGEDGWKWLQELTEKYRLLNQPFFNESDIFADAPDERMIPLALFLNSGGNHLAMQQKLSDAEKTFLISLRLYPDEFNVAHASIAVVYKLQGNNKKARFHAGIALRNLEEANLFQELNPSGIDQMRNELKEIIENKIK